MILDLDYGFLFLKSTKTAGTSVEIALSCVASHNSIITPTVDEKLRTEWGGRPPQNYSADPCAIKWSGKPQKYDTPPWGAVHFFNHMSVDQVIAQIGLETFLKLFSFGFTRNPIDRALSSYTWIAACNRPYYEPLSVADHREHFRDMLRTSFDSTKKWLYSDVYEAPVTVVYRYEEMQSALDDMLRRCGLADRWSAGLPTAKGGFKSILGFPREELIDEAARTYIEEVCAWEYQNHYA